jgi:hypothetical protein
MRSSSQSQCIPGTNGQNGAGGIAPSGPNLVGLPGTQGSYTSTTPPPFAFLSSALSSGGVGIGGEQGGVPVVNNQNVMVATQAVNGGPGYVLLTW